MKTCIPAFALITMCLITSCRRPDSERNMNAENPASGGKIQEAPIQTGGPTPAPPIIPASPGKEQ